MARKVGFGETQGDARKQRPADTPRAAPPARPPAPPAHDPARDLGWDDAPTRPRPQGFAFLVPSIIMCGMAGVGLFIAYRALLAGEILGFAIGTIFGVGLLTAGISRAIKAALGLHPYRRPRKDHRWRMDDGDGPGT